MAMDDATDYCCTMLLKSNDELPMRMIELNKELKGKNQVQVKKIRCDNAGENTSFEKLAKAERLGLHFETLQGRHPNKMAEWKGSLLHFMEESDQC